MEINGKVVDKPGEEHFSVSRNLHFRRVRIIKRIATHLVLIAVAVYSIFPIYYMFVNSLSPGITLASVSINSLLPLPTRLNLANYTGLFRFDGSALLNIWLPNTLFYSGSATIIALGLSFSAGLALSRFRIPGKRVILYMMLILSTFPLAIMVIPLYDMFSELSLTNSYFGMIILYSGGAVIFNAWLIKNFTDGIPADFEESAQIDGHTRTQALFRVLLPMVKPVLIMSMLLAFFGPYSDYLLINMMVSNGKLDNMAQGLYKYSQISSQAINFGQFSAFSIVMGLPIFILFIVFQRYLVSGFSIATYK
ncbi:MAG: ABC transporter permease subunit [Candidatus Thermoplasmatota archaeon]|nr:ABC transporter permease subunit [Candidatus Thermoplasmatota archaeon]MCL5438326.1 ABC transporter permease subunit [Candidatus Thermoplasmatota archaeon]